MNMLVNALIRKLYYIEFKLEGPVYVFFMLQKKVTH